MIDFLDRKIKRGRLRQRVVNFYGFERPDIVLFLANMLTKRFRCKVLVIDNTGNNVFGFLIPVLRRNEKVCNVDGIDFSCGQFFCNEDYLTWYDVVLNFVGYNVLSNPYFEEIEHHSVLVTNIEPSAGEKCRSVLECINGRYTMVFVDWVDPAMPVNRVAVELGLLPINMHKIFTLSYDADSYGEFIKYVYYNEFEYGKLSGDLQYFLKYLITDICPDAKLAVTKPRRGVIGEFDE